MESFIIDVGSTSHLVRVGSDRLTATYLGKGSHSADVGVFRAVAPLPNSVDVWFFELEVLEPLATVGTDPVECGVCLGLATRMLPANCQLGSHSHSYGWRALDGKVVGNPASGDPKTGAFSSTASRGREFSSPWGRGDVVGCGFDFVQQSIFFTKNGVMLGTAFQGVPCFASTDEDLVGPGFLLHATVGLHSPGERVRLNFGAAPFAFDLTAYKASLKSVLERSLAAIEVPKAVVHRLVGQYLLQQGFRDTAVVLQLAEAGTAAPEPNQLPNVAAWPPTLPVLGPEHGHGDEDGLMAWEPSGARGRGERTDGAGPARPVHFHTIAPRQLHETVEERARLRQWIVQGRSQAAFEHMRTHHGDLLRTHTVAALALSGQVFIDLVKEQRTLDAIAFSRAELLPFLNSGHAGEDAGSAAPRSAWLAVLLGVPQRRGFQHAGQPRAPSTVAKRRRRAPSLYLDVLSPNCKAKECTCPSSPGCACFAEGMRRNVLPWVADSPTCTEPPPTPTDFTPAVAELMGLLAYESISQSPLSFLAGRGHAEAVADLINDLVLCAAEERSAQDRSAGGGDTGGQPAPSALQALLHQLLATKQLGRELADDHGEIYRLPA